jgi:hypothetical protein
MLREKYPEVIAMTDIPHEAYMAAQAIDELMDYIDSIKAQPAKIERLQKPVACIIGARGSAFDSPETKRAYTYAQQPGNLIAMALGVACLNATRKTAGDCIDRGLALLQELQKEGFGVFDLGAEYTPPAQPAVPLTDEQLADCVPEGAQIIEREGERNRVSMTRQQLHEFVANVAKLREKSAPAQPTGDDLTPDDAPQPADLNLNLNCKSVQARLATQWGYVKAGTVQEPPVFAELLCVCGAEWEWRNRDWELVSTPAAQPAAWVGLTADEMLEALIAVDPTTKRLPIGFTRFAQAIEAKLKEKNS